MILGIAAVDARGGVPGWTHLARLPRADRQDPSAKGWTAKSPSRQGMNRW